MSNDGCPPEILSRLREALKSLPNPDELALALCDATIHADLHVELESVRGGLNQLFLLFGTALVFVMHGGFAMLAAGAIRSKNAINILLQTLMDACASALTWYCVGFGFAYGIGDHPNAFIGDAMFALARLKSHNTGSSTGRWLDVVFQWAFCATAVTIPAGSVAERCNFNAYLAYSTFISALLYPLAARWVWCSRGWLGYGTLKPLLGCGMIDFAGSGVVHMLGGLSGLAGAVMVGPRMGRFDSNNQPVPLPGHSAVLVVLGTVLLWFGWYGFNPVSTLVIDTADAADVAGRAAVTTTLAGGAGGVGCLLWTMLRTRTFDLYALCNGVLCGFVAVTAGCHVYEPWAAILCGAGAGIIFDLACILLLKLKIDDPLGAAPMHGGCGAYGVLFVGLLAKKGYIEQSYVRESYPNGLFYGGGGMLLACQLIGVITIAGWTLGLMMPFFWTLKQFNLLRVPPEEEMDGLDVSRHFSRAYNMDNLHDGLQFTTKPISYNPDTLPTNHVKKVSVQGADGIIVGDAIMRGEVLSDTAAAQQKTAWGSAPPPAGAGGQLQLQRSLRGGADGVAAQKSVRYSSKVASQDSFLPAAVRGAVQRKDGDDSAHSLSLQMRQQQLPDLLALQEMPSPRLGKATSSGLLDVSQSQKSGILEMQKSPQAQQPQHSAFPASTVTGAPSPARKALSPVVPEATGRSLTGSRSGKNGSAASGPPLANDPSRGVSGAFEDVDDISVHQLNA